MSRIVWSSAYSVGDEAMDRDHHRLADLINALADAVEAQETPETITRLIDEIVRHTRRHLAAEEQVLQEIGFPELDKHKADHLRLEDQMDQARARYHACPEPVVARETLNFLKDWFVRHVLRVDMQYKSFFEARQEEGRRVAPKPTSGEPA